MSLAELTRNAAHVLPEGGLDAKLKLGRPLRVKLGIDVTAPDVTLGNGIPLQRMRAFQDEGHTGVLIVGDYTTRIGDPSGRKTERPMIDPAVIDENAQRYFEHASTIIDPERTELRFNSEWLGKQVVVAKDRPGFIVNLLLVPYLLDAVRVSGASIAQRLRGVRGAGLLLAVETARPAAEVVDTCRQRGLLVGTAGDSALRLTPPLVVTDVELDHGLRILEEVLSQ